MTMEFSFTEEQKMFRDNFKAFAAKEIAPIAQQYDEQEEFPYHLFKKLAELGGLGLMLPERY